MSHQGLTRRRFLRHSALAAGSLTIGRFVTGCATPAAQAPRPSLRPVSGQVIDLDIAEQWLLVGGRPGRATTVGGGIPGPEIRLKEGQDVTLRVRNRLDVDSSIHWHGLLVPPEMDGVPGVSFAGIGPGRTFEYRFPIRQSGTYWYHSHSGFQEQTGLYGPLIIEPDGPDPHRVERDYSIVLSDWTFEDPHTVQANLKKYGGYYNFQRRTLANLGEEAEAKGLAKSLGDRMSWAGMRMDATDISDVTGVTYTYLLNGLAPAEDWRAAFAPGERVRLRFINAGAATYFDVRIPGVPMTVVHVDGQPVEPVEVDEFRLAIAETVDVIVQPNAGAYAIFAEAVDRSGFARGTLSSDPAAAAPTPARRPRPLLTMADMGMDHGAHGGTHPASAPTTAHAGHEMPASAPTSQPHGMAGSPVDPACLAPIQVIARHGPDEHGAGNAMIAEVAQARLDDPGPGLRDAPWRVLTYGQLRRAEPGPTARPPDRDIVLHLTGNMERYMWSFDGVQYSPDMPSIQMKRGERVRFVLINDTMMAHPIHLHGMFFELEVGACERNPLKHTVNVQPAERASFVVTAEEVGRWAFHCHILYHMDAGMFRVVEVLS